VLSYPLGAEMLNFGALMSFMGVNVAAFLHYYVRAPEKRMRYLFPPVIGFLVCLLLWLNLSWPAKIAKSVWMAAGVAYGAWRTKGFHDNLVNFEVPVAVDAGSKPVINDKGPGGYVKVQGNEQASKDINTILKKWL
jgi:putrescine importer